MIFFGFLAAGFFATFLGFEVGFFFVGITLAVGLLFPVSLVVVADGVLGTVALGVAFAADTVI